jgi:HPt (histidine-containing phosphotransfer) domain-containing protein
MDGDSSTPVNRRKPATATLREQTAAGAGSTWSPKDLIERLGGDEALARQLVALFLAEYPSLLRTLHASCASGRADDVRRAAHAAKGCIANFIEGGPQATAYAIERLAAEGKVDEAAPLVATLEREVAALAALMNRFAQSASCAS